MGAPRLRGLGPYIEPIPAKFAGFLQNFYDRFLAPHPRSPQSRRLRACRRPACQWRREGAVLRVLMPMRRLESAILVAAALALPNAATAASNLLCPDEDVSFNPGNGEDIVVPDGFKVSVFASGLNFPTGIAFRGDSRRFEVYVVESGAFGPSRCDTGAAWQG